MNSIWNKNISSFIERFPQLSQILTEQIELYRSNCENGHSVYRIEPAKNGQITAFENNVPLHSKYNPQREAEQVCSQFDVVKSSTAVFFSCGLGYVPISFAQKYPDAPIVIVEPDAAHIFEAFNQLDWSPVFLHKEVVFLLNASAEDTAVLIEHYNVEECKIFSNPSQTSHCSIFFQTVTDILSKHKKKHEINLNTLERFSHLWLKNSVKNLHYIAELDGVNKYESSTELPFVILAAGPSLEKILPYLNEIKKRSIIVCVDTALHACLRQNVEPDFIILVDPQYACFMHLEFLSSLSSTLITESAVYPSVFRFKCKEKILCSSMFPLGQYFENLLGNKGKLEAGGSVTTTAWDFARFCGTKNIFIAGMDLGFPNRQIHIRGSQFEEKTHMSNTRINTSESSGISSLFSATVSMSTDYNGNNLLTDQRMSLFSWWFESTCKQAKQNGINTYTLTSESLKIEGIEPFNIEDFIKTKECLEEKKLFFEKAELKSAEQKNRTSDFNQVLESFTNELNELCSLSKKGISLCEKALADRLKAPFILSELEKIDSKILKSGGKNAASLIFPTSRQLEQKALNLPKNKDLYPLYYSRLIYTELLSAARQYLELIQHS